MREIKFRQFIGSKMVYWGFLEGGAFFGPSANGANSENAQNTPQMQYTGLKDKNGKEIFEGDIVHLHESIYYNAEQRRILGEKADWINLDGLCVVEWDDEGADFQMSNKEICRGFGSRGQQEIEIIGNIYENSDLIV